MTMERIIRAVLTVVFCFCATMVTPAVASEIVGTTSGLSFPGMFVGSSFYSIDPLTGSATLLHGPVLCCSFGASGSPDADTIFMFTGINLWEVNVTTFQATVVGGILHGIDVAFDRGTNTLYETSGSALFSVQCPSPPGMCTETQVGPAFPTSDMQALGFVPGAGYMASAMTFSIASTILPGM